MNIITRSEAKKLGLNHYFTGKPCKHGHIAQRNKYGQCMECNRLKINTGRYRDGRKSYRAKNRLEGSTALEYENAYREANPDKVAQWKKNRTPEKKRKAAKKYREKLLKDKDRYEAHLASSRAWAKRRRLANPEKKKEKDRAWKANNRAYCNHKNKLREAGKAQRTPAWADLDAIRFFYECCPAGCHVDHIIPLFGKNISGLHVETNLQWLPAIENMRKNNSWN